MFARPLIRKFDDDAESLCISNDGSISEIFDFSS